VRNSRAAFACLEKGLNLVFTSVRKREIIVVGFVWVLSVELCDNQLLQSSRPSLRRDLPSKFRVEVPTNGLDGLCVCCGSCRPPSSWGAWEMDKWAN
jgi:hypothetical protein